MDVKTVTLSSRKDKKRYLIFMKVMKSVTKEEYDAFVKEYPRKLTPHTVTFCTPMINGLYDFTINTIDNDGTVCMVASQSDRTYNTPESYEICTNIDEVVEFSKKCAMCESFDMPALE